MLLALITAALAGGGPPNVLVLVNGDDPDAVATADHYAAARQLPPGHVCALSGIDPAIDEIGFDDFDLLIRAPVEACRDALPQPHEIDALVIVKGLPYVVTLPEFVASLDAALQVGRATDVQGAEIAGQGQRLAGAVYAASVPNPVFTDGTCTDLALANPSAGWYTGGCALAALDALPIAFHRADAPDALGYDFAGELYVVTRLDGFDQADARALVDRAVAADGSFPDGEIACMAAADEARGARDPECEYVTRLLAADGLNATFLPTFDPALSGHTLAALLTGTTSLQGGIDGNTWQPGAFAGNLTSFGAVPQNFHCSADGTVCPESESQTSIARFVRGGATAAHGTAAEPLNNTFPNAGLLILYTSGYALGESVLLSQRYLYWQNVVLGDPLTTPWAERPVVTVPEAVRAGGTLTITATHPDGVADLALYVAGVRVAGADGDTLTWEVAGGDGDALDLLAVARSKIATVQRTGWPVPEQNLRGRTEGWTAVSRTIGPAAAPDPASPDSEDEGGCGCATGPRGSPGLALAAVAGLCAFRRRSKRRGDRVQARPCDRH